MWNGSPKDVEAKTVVMTTHPDRRGFIEAVAASYYDGCKQPVNTYFVWHFWAFLVWLSMRFVVNMRGTLGRVALMAFAALVFAEPSTACQAPRGGTLDQIENQLRRGTPHQFHSYPLADHVLAGSGYRNLTAWSCTACAVHCLLEDSCKSFNFCLDDHRCELNLNSLFPNDTCSVLAPSHGCLYFDEHQVRSTMTPCGTKNVNIWTDLWTGPITYPIRVDFSVNYSPSDSNDQDWFLMVFWSLRSNKAVYSIVIHPNNTQTTGIYLGLFPTCDAVALTAGTEPLDGSTRFWITYDDGDLSVGKCDRFGPFLHYKDPNSTRHDQVDLIDVSTRFDVTALVTFYGSCPPSF